MGIAVGQYQEVYHMCSWSSRKGKKKNVEEMAEKISNLMNTIDSQISITQ